MVDVTLSIEGEAVVISWFKKEGSQVKAKEPLAELMSEKVSFELEAPADGILARIFVPEQGVAKKGDVVAVIEEAPIQHVMVPTVAAPSAEAARPEAEREVAPIASPSARRLARELGVDLSRVKGSGGRIVEQDVREFAMKGGFLRAEGARAPEKLAVAQVVPLAGMRRIIGERMMKSLQEMAQLTLTAEVDVTELLKLKEELSQKDITVTDLFVKAVALAVKDHPRLRSQLVGEEIHIMPDINLGIAVALEDGLIVPVIRNADSKSVSEISSELKILSERARQGKLRPEDVTSGSFTVSNLGMFGVDWFTPIINPPQCAILGVGQTKEKLVLTELGIAKRSFAPLSLTIDHRVIDGAVGGKFLQTLSEVLSTPHTLVS